ncbi:MULTISPECIES: (2Fe-2S)-binding protein [unclassified Burkholderia]|uniref:(2Fe-2S)-binding protein n=1 Tax=unclassified Burkholderia TaxID=2613784 RepID=UPI000468EBDB|nr:MULTISPECIES: (2Fe-2S)-binding protein [unclassified Burkholderia]NIE84391.1 (2Fe-2S)-binding protein [Burkholderia sp. Tr-860]NIF62681.1 (2Fe-2S)-binding protein [Burkholderia sp. Cy-647]NIF70911.1 (2Fe-2S)-binding protein [Burkholderia sp. Ap-962]NIF94624.1 (2Fe-2S)-binding protein [Burkholderia sp. Ax-1720]
METRTISVVVNGTTYQREVEPRRMLGDFLRHDLELTGTHYGCEHGVCGACTVLIEGRTARACLTLAVQADGRSLSTVEGLAHADGTLNELQKAFAESHALQCGFCTPGMLMTLTELLAETDSPSEAEIREAITGNLCRCTGYQPIVAAALLAAQRLREQRAAAPAHATE